MPALPLATRYIWDAVRDEVIRRAVRQKVESHAGIRAVLLATGDDILVEDAPTDFCWSCGTTAAGRTSWS